MKTEKSSKQVVLEATDISIGYKRGKKVLKEVHRGLSFELQAGELTCLLGPNGAGKSTLLRSLGASQSLLQGEIRLQEKTLSSYRERELSRLIGLVLTEKSTAGALRVHELVALGRHPHTGFFGRMSAHDHAIVDKAMASAGILDKRSCYVAELSDGERQKVMIAKALAQESPIIILDEPTSFLDIISRIEIMNLLRQLARENNKAILLSTHDLEQALLTADKLWLLSREEGLIQGTPEELIFSNAMDRLFPHRNITFDKLTGSFRLPVTEPDPVIVSAGPELFFWSKNLLNRYGFTALSTPKIEEPAPSCPRLVVESADSIRWEVPGESSVFIPGFGALARYLSELRSSGN